VEADVLRGGTQHCGIVAEEAETVVASLTQQSANRAGGMIMIKVLWSGITADRAPVVLRRPQLGDVILRHLVATVEIGGAALSVLARLATTAEA